jgi:hypothetical protein
MSLIQTNDIVCKFTEICFFIVIFLIGDVFQRHSTLKSVLKLLLENIK